MGVGRQKTEDGRRKTEVGRRKTEVGRNKKRAIKALFLF